VCSRQVSAGTLLASCLRDALLCDAAALDAAAISEGPRLPAGAAALSLGDLRRLVPGDCEVPPAPPRFDLPRIGATGGCSSAVIHTPITPESHPCRS
jgi:hypothetical protein